MYIKVQSQKHGNFNKIKSDLEIRASGVLIILIVVFFLFKTFFIYLLLSNLLLINVAIQTDL